MSGVAGGGTSRLDGTVSTHLVRLLVDAARRAGADEAQIARTPGTDDALLRDELNRIPMSSLVRLWELIANARPGAGAGAAVVAGGPARPPPGGSSRPGSPSAIAHRPTAPP
ncbi:hypothetical protein ACFVVM_15410 [Nocardia sp. NPDC058176]|uniref:hypothetical protein n=1 Tax=Nocardia sp. NPDC058176 TaxID=3346368 RepID=UPI0036D8E7B9